jgi:hypothetical protein
VLVAALAAGVIDQDMADRLGRGGEKVTAVRSVLIVRRADQTQVRFVNQGGGGERLSGRLLRQLPGGELAKLVVNER